MASPAPASVVDMKAAEGGVAALNAMAKEEFTAECMRMCASPSWSAAMTEARPFGSLLELQRVAEKHWWALPASEWKLAFAGHGKLGEKKLEQKEAMERAGDDVLSRLYRANEAYTKKFGWKVIVLAAGKSPEQILSIILRRTAGGLEEELVECAEQVALITALRLCGAAGVSPPVTFDPAAWAPHSVPLPVRVRVSLAETGAPVPSGVRVLFEQPRSPSAGGACATSGLPLARGLVSPDGSADDILPPFYPLIMSPGTQLCVTIDASGYARAQGWALGVPRVSTVLVVRDAKDPAAGMLVAVRIAPGSCLLSVAPAGADAAGSKL